MRDRGAVCLSVSQDSHPLPYFLLPTVRLARNMWEAKEMVWGKTQ